MQQTIEFRLNGSTIRLAVEPDRMLLWVLRTELGLTGAKYGCGQSLCGTCTVVLNRKAVRSCQTPMKEVQGKDVVTIEGLERDGKLHSLQKAFLEHDAYQCGFCTPGMILSAYALLLRESNPGRDRIIAEMDDNLCRCGSHARIVRAIQSAAVEMKGGDA